MDVKTIQGTLEKVFNKLTTTPIQVRGASKTDKGVHAIQNIAQVDLPPRFNRHTQEYKEHFDEKTLMASLNSMLRSEDILITKVDKVDDTYNVKDTFERTYIYKVIQIENEIPLLKNRYWFITPRLEINIEKIRESLEYFKGIHNFTAFSSFNKSNINKNPIREILEIEFNEFDASEYLNHAQKIKEYQLRVKGSSFMYHQIRIMMGFLMKVGTKKYKPEETKFLLESCERHLRINSGMAPPEGLYLTNVRDGYGEET
eukprot:gene8776-724_t